MNYRNKIIADLTQLEDFARTCFVCHLKLSNGQGTTENKYIDLFMADLTSGELLPGKNCPEDMKLGTDSIALDACIDWILPNCRDAVAPKDCYLYTLVGEWVHDNLIKCENCDCYVLENDAIKRDVGFVCENCDDTMPSDTPLSDIADMERGL